jgi:TetR/AcrR family transcriptional regulator, regulator of cefoperazone and chloramphenicol sensitivity
MTHSDQDTRERLIEAAGRLFGDRGFREVTVREICRAADANVAAVNYHFRDKLGLYREVLERAIALLQETTELAGRAPGAESVEDRLRAHISAYVHRLLSHGGDSWLHRLINREVAEPTPSLDDIVDRAIRPRIRQLAVLVAELMACDVRDERVARSVASIQAQCTMALPHPIRDRLAPRPRWTAAEVEALARHIADFSVAGARAVAASGSPLAAHHNTRRASRPTGV